MERIKLKKLLKRLKIKTCKGVKEIEITGICANSKLVAPGNLFIAKKGLSHDGTEFIPEAIAAGATAVLTDLYNPFLSDVVQIIHPDVNAIEALLAKEYYRLADEKLFLVGITGTNGKTTTACLVKHILDKLGSLCGLIGSIEWIIGKHHFPATHTTPDVLTNFKLFNDMTLAKCKSCVMEVSSHALDQGRVKEVEFDVAVFTNLDQDHLDYHMYIQNYLQSKLKLFSQLDPLGHKGPKTAIINLDSASAEEIMKNTKAHLFTYGIDARADLSAKQINLTPEGIECFIHYQEEKVKLVSHLIGKHNLYNLLGAIGVGLSHGYCLKKIIYTIKSFNQVPGRLEKVDNSRGLHIFVDYAHTENALECVLSALREIKQGKLIVVFGCGGNRDRQKRAKMGGIAEKLADVVIVTTDNPRQEDPQEIINDILKGCKNPKTVLTILNRKEAIFSAIKRGSSKDIVLIAGKGHETYQVFSQQSVVFDDRLVAKLACESAVFN